MPRPSRVKKKAGVEILNKNRFSVFVAPSDKVGRAILEGWIEHFAAHGVLAVIAFTDKGFAVYRDGMENPFDEV